MAGDIKFGTPSTIADPGSLLSPSGDNISGRLELEMARFDAAYQASQLISPPRRRPNLSQCVLPDHEMPEIVCRPAAR